MKRTVFEIYGDQLDPPELVERCLNCNIPGGICLGERKCKAQMRQERLRKQEVCKYAFSRGVSSADIERQTDGEISCEFARREKAKMAGRLLVGNSWDRSDRK